MGRASARLRGYIAVLVLALYIDSDRFREFYTNAWAMWLVPVILYWISRVWFLAQARRSCTTTPSSSRSPIASACWPACSSHYFAAAAGG